MTYSGNKLFNTNSIFAAICILVLFFLLPVYENRILFITIIFLATYLIYLREAFYFSMEQDKLIVRNIVLPFWKKVYTKSNIDHILVADKGLTSFSKAKLKIFTASGKSIFYRGASLRLEDWRQLLRAIRNLNITISVEHYLLKSSADNA